MEKSIIEVFTSPTCPHCPNAVKVAEEISKERQDVIVKNLSTALPEGNLKARKFNILSVPTVFVKGPGHEEILAIRGVPSKMKLNELLDISQGLKKIG